MLLAVPKYGRVKVNKVLMQCRISPSKTIGGLSQRQRTELVGRCCAAGRRLRLRHHRPLRGRQGHADPHAARARAPSSSCRVSATTARPRPGEERRRRLPLPHRRGVRPPRQAGDFVEHACYSGRRYGTLRSELERRRRRARRWCSRSRSRARARSARRCPRRCRCSSRRRRTRRCATRLIGRGTDTPSRSSAGSRPRARSCPPRASSATSSSTTGSRTRSAELEELVRGELGPR